MSEWREIGASFYEIYSGEAVLFQVFGLRKWERRKRRLYFGVSIARERDKQRQLSLSKASTFIPQMNV